MSADVLVSLERLRYIKDRLYSNDYKRLTGDEIRDLANTLDAVLHNAWVFDDLPELLYVPLRTGPAALAQDELVNRGITVSPTISERLKQGQSATLISEGAMYLITTEEN